MSTNYIITECPNHGTTEVADRASFVAYVEVALSCVILREMEDAEGYGEHTDEHAEEGTSCWKCCNLMTVDPYDVLPPAAISSLI